MIPPDWRLAFDARFVDEVIIGGHPRRLLRLSPAGRQYARALQRGGPVGASAGAQRLARRLLDTGVANPLPCGGGSGAVTVVIPVRDRAEDLERTLRSLGSVERVIVVDDGSRDHSVAAVATRHGADVVRHDENRGPAAARNTGWRLATTELVVFVDADCQPEPAWLDALLPHFGDPEVVAVAPRIVTSSTAGLPATVAAYERDRGSLDRGAVPAVVRIGSPVSFVPTAALAVRRAALQAADGFDESLRVGEDVDFVWRIEGTVRYEPRARVGHPARSSATAWLRQRFEYGTSAASLARRHGSDVAPLVVSRTTVAAWGMVAVGAPAVGVGIAAASTVALARRLPVRAPEREAVRLVGYGQLAGGRAIAEALRRSWWPLAIVAAGRWRRARPAVAAAFTVPLLVEWVQQRPRLDPLRWMIVRVVDDMAYGAGVWTGCWRQRSWTALRPRLSASR